MGYLHPHLPPHLPPCGVARTPECGVLQQIQTTIYSGSLFFEYKRLGPCLLAFMTAKARTRPIQHFGKFATLLIRRLIGISLPIIQLGKVVLYFDCMDLRNDARSVKSVRVVVHTLGVWPNGTISDNHWSIYLLLENNQSSVRMNMRAESGNPKGILEWSPNLAYTLHTSAIQHWDYSFISGVTVANVYDLIMRNRRDQYKMSGGGSGCRWWM